MPCNRQRKKRRKSTGISARPQSSLISGTEVRAILTFKGSCGDCAPAVEVPTQTARTAERHARKNKRADMKGGLRSWRWARRYCGKAAKSERSVAAWREKINHRTGIHLVAG